MKIAEHIYTPQGIGTTLMTNVLMLQQVNGINE